MVITPECETLVAPSTTEVAAAVGLSTTPTTDFYDLVVVGGGPAGLGAAVYGASEGLRTLLVERQATGGQAGQSSRIENYLGFPDGVSGAQLTDRARRQATKFGAEILTARDVVGLRTNGPARVVAFGDGTEVAAHVVIVATGVSYRDLDAPGVDRPGGQRPLLRLGRERGRRLRRRRRLHRRRRQLGRAGCGVLLPGRQVGDPGRARRLAGTQHVALPHRAAGRHRQRVGAALHDRRGGARQRSPGGADPAAHARRVRPSGSTPATPSCSSARSRAPTGWPTPSSATTEGFVVTGPDLIVDRQRPRGWPLDRDPWPLEASIPGVFVAGDVRADSVKRVASAVGEGAMAVTLAHRYLGAP